MRAVMARKELFAKNAGVSKCFAIPATAKENKCNT